MDQSGMSPSRGAAQETQETQETKGTQKELRELSLSLSPAIKESLAATCRILELTKAAITPDNLATRLLQTGYGCTHVQRHVSTVLGMLQGRQ